MPVGAIAGATAVAGIGSAVIGSNAQKKAANQAADAQGQTTRENNALAREFYERNTGNLSPFMQNGLRASNALSGLLLGSASAPSAGGQPNALLGLTTMPAQAAQPALDPNTYGAIQGPPAWKLDDGVGNTAAYSAPVMAQPVAQAPAATDYNAAFQQYLNSTGYQFRMGEGNKALNASFAAQGLGNSGAAAKAAIRFGQNTASDEFGRYLGYLSGQQQVGMAAGSALAGVGQNLVGTITSNNQAASGATQNALMNAGNATANMWGNIGGSIGNALGAYGAGIGATSSYGRNPYGIVGAGGIY